MQKKEKKKKEGEAGSRLDLFVILLASSENKIG